MAPYVPANTDGSRTIVAVNIFFIVFAFLALVARFWARWLRKIRPGADDWVILAAFVPLAGQTAILLITVYYGGVGHHETTLSPSNITVLYKCLTALQFTYGSEMALIRTSVCLLLLRIFVGPRFKIAAYAIMAYAVLWGVMTILIGAAICRPFSCNWNKEQECHCGNSLAAYISIAVLDIISDILILVLPLPSIWNLQLPTRNKVGLSAIFLLGVFDLVAGVLRIVYLASLENAKDYTFDAVNTWIWSSVEPGLALALACGPTFRPLIDLILDGTSRMLFYATGKQLSTPRSRFGTRGPLSTMDNNGTQLSRIAQGTGPTSSGYFKQSDSISDLEADVDPAREIRVGVQRDLEVIHSPTKDPKDGPSDTDENSP